MIVDGRRRTFPPTGSVVIGRGDESHIRLDHASVSRRHAVLTPTAGGWMLTDAGRNGTYVDGRRVDRLVLARLTVAHLGVPPDGVPVTLVPLDAPAHPTPGRRPGALAGGHEPSARRLTIGRGPDNDIVLDDVLVAGRHAELRREPAGWRLTDWAAGRRTFVNGRRVSAAVVGPADVISIGHDLLQVQPEGRIVGYVDEGGNAFEARGLTVHAGQRTLLHDVSFALPGKVLLAVVGPSGAGKSTLLGAITGARPASVGKVRYAGRGLYDNYEELRHRIAVVPQDDVLHAQLTVRAALGHVARLRFPTDTPEPERRRRIDEVLAESSVWPSTRTSASRSCPAGSASAPGWRWSCSPSRRCCSWTSPPPGWTPAPTGR